MVDETFDRNIRSYEVMSPPVKYIERYKPSSNGLRTVLDGRKSIENILNGTDPRKIIIVGPCSVHDVDESIEYAHMLKGLSAQVEDKFLVVMRTYFDKSRTGLGWQGFIHDPDLDGKLDFDKGISESRRLLRDIADIGLPTATEVVDSITIQSIIGLTSWTAVGARSVESRDLRNLSSGLSTAVGFKNRTDGNIDVAIEAMKYSREGQSFRGVTIDGNLSKVTTNGNAYVHLVLRGGSTPNYYPEDVDAAQKRLKYNGLNHRLIVDCSHGNSNKDYKRQPEVFDCLIGQIKDGNKDIVGIMLESNIYEGSQKVVDPKILRKGISITDGCISFETTKELILDAYKRS